MSLKDQPQKHENIPVQRAAAEAPATTSAATGPVAAVLRIGLGLIFLWAFLDKTFGWGYATPTERAWINGGSPTKGFLGNIDHGPLADMFRSWAGAGWADWLFMIALLGIGLALILGIGLRVAAVSGTVLLVLMWAAEWPMARFTDAGEPTMSTHPFLDDHLIYAVALILLAVMAAGNTWGFGKYWANLGFVKKNPWLR